MLSDLNGEAVCASSQDLAKPKARTPRRSAAGWGASLERAYEAVPVPVCSGFLSGFRRLVMQARESHDAAAEDTCSSPTAAAGFRTLGGHLEMVCSVGDDLVRCASKNILPSGLNWTVGQSERASRCEYSAKARELSGVLIWRNCG